MNKVRDIPAASGVRIWSDGAIATKGVGEGRLVPILIVDCSEKVELRDLIFAHKDSSPGDVAVTWATPKRGKGKVFLLLNFLKPSNLEVLLQFDIKAQGGLVDAILHSHALYLQPGESGMRVADGLDKAKILIEIQDTGFMPTWEKIYSNSLVITFKKAGFNKKEASNAMEQHKLNLRKIWHKRMRRV